MNRMQEKYNNEVVPALRKAFDLKNIMQVPRITKVVVNIGMGEALDNPKALESAVSDLTTITGQHPVTMKARKSIANFKLREGRLIGTKVTLRGDRMWAFLDRLMNTALRRELRGRDPAIRRQIEKVGRRVVAEQRRSFIVRVDDGAVGAMRDDRVTCGIDQREEEAGALVVREPL